MEILIWIIAGVIIGLFASLVMTNSGGVALNTVIGAIGAVIGGWVTRMFTDTVDASFNWYAFLASVLGGLVLIGIIKMIRN